MCSPRAGTLAGGIDTAGHGRAGQPGHDGHTATALAASSPASVLTAWDTPLGSGADAALAPLVVLGLIPSGPTSTVGGLVQDGGPATAAQLAGRGATSHGVGPNFFALTPMRLAAVGGAGGGAAPTALRTAAVMAVPGGRASLGLIGPGGLLIGNGLDGGPGQDGNGGAGGVGTSTGTGDAVGGAGGNGGKGGAGAPGGRQPGAHGTNGTNGTKGANGHDGV